MGEFDHIPPTPEPPPIPDVLRDDVPSTRRVGPTGGGPGGGPGGGASGQEPLSRSLGAVGLGRGLGSGALPLGKVFAIGMDFAYGVIACAALGWVLDWWLKTSPRWLLVGAVLGVVVAMYRFIREGLKMARAAGKGGTGSGGGRAKGEG